MDIMGNPKHSADELLGAALSLPPGRRSAYLDQACSEAPELRRQVEELLLNSRHPGVPPRKWDFPSGSESPTTEIGATAVRGLAVGTKLGRYTIVEPLGAGGMGIVYRAHDDKLERAVAIKILAPGLLTGDESRRRFHQEAVALAKLSHPHIGALYDAGQQDGVDYIVMECIPGVSLAEKLKSGPLSVKDATSIALQIAEALEEAHEHGVVHRDLKPGNVMITPKGQAKVLDFGLAKLLVSTGEDATQSILETRGIIGTPAYMSPEQALGKTLDARTDLWSLGVIYYELLTGKTPFHAGSSIAVLRAIIDDSPVPLQQLRPDAPTDARQIISRAIAKGPAERYQAASDVVRDTSHLLTRLSGTTEGLQRKERRLRSWLIASIAGALVAALAAGSWMYQRSSGRHWAREDAIPQINDLLAQNKSLAAFLLLNKAQGYLPSDPQLKQIAEEDTTVVSVTSSPSGATVNIQDYLAPNAPWYRLGTTPLSKIKIPKGYFRWKVSKPGTGEIVVAPQTEDTMKFNLDAAQKSPPGMVLSPGGDWRDYIAFVGWAGPYKLPPYYVDRYEVTNSEFQKFVDSGGYEKKEYWREPVKKDGRDLTWNEAMAQFRDTTGRPGPSTWVGGHYPEGKADLPVSGVSWYEASAYAAFAGKQLPVLAQWFQTAPSDIGDYAVQVSNFSGSAPSVAGTYQGVGPFGTYDTAGNVREWVANAVDDNLRFILGGSWKSLSYLYSSPEALSPSDRSDTNGFRCVRNLAALPEASTEPVKRVSRDFARYKPVSDDVFHAYQLLYAYPAAPLNSKVEGIVNETADWREEKITFDAAYGGERMDAYLFLPKNVRPPYQTVLFFPSARVLSIRDSDNGRQLGDLKFCDYVIQSGRALMYPIYQETYERRVKSNLPGAAQYIELTVQHYKDAARSLDYLATRADIDKSRMAYLGVSMGAVEGVIHSTLLQERLKTVVLLDGGFFLDSPPPGGDAADFAPRMKKPVLMVNGRYDFAFSLEKAQNPLFAMLGTPDENKQHLVLDTPHDVTAERPQLIKAVLDWLDHYLGRVNE
jgi:serine/threonine protein kinase/dienelactone hydrolase